MNCFSEDEDSLGAQLEADRAEQRFLREMCEDPYVPSNWVEVAEFTPRKPVSRQQLDLFGDEGVA
jgi:hypothetical protein